MANPLPRAVLVIDDDPEITELLADSLTLFASFTVDVATDGVQGLMRLEARRPDCIVVDVRMPNLNGIQFVRALRGDPTTADIPIVILSALVEDRDQLTGISSGADAYLRKPVRMAELIAAIERSLALSDAQREDRLRDLVDDTDGK
jgi:CheY-like chemotaxis protein